MVFEKDYHDSKVNPASVGSGPSLFTQLSNAAAAASASVDHSKSPFATGIGSNIISSLTAATTKDPSPPSGAKEKETVVVAASDEELKEEPASNHSLRDAAISFGSRLQDAHAKVIDHVQTKVNEAKESAVAKDMHAKAIDAKDKAVAAGKDVHAKVKPVVDKIAGAISDYFSGNHPSNDGTKTESQPTEVSPAAAAATTPSKGNAGDGIVAASIDVPPLPLVKESSNNVSGEVTVKKADGSPPQAESRTLSPENKVERDAAGVSEAGGAICLPTESLGNYPSRKSTDQDSASGLLSDNDDEEGSVGSRSVNSYSSGSSRNRGADKQAPGAAQPPTASAKARAQRRKSTREEMQATTAEAQKRMADIDQKKNDKLTKKGDRAKSPGFFDRVGTLLGIKQTKHVNKYVHHMEEDDVDVTNKVKRAISRKPSIEESEERALDGVASSPIATIEGHVTMSTAAEEKRVEPLSTPSVIDAVEALSAPQTPFTATSSLSVLENPEKASKDIVLEEKEMVVDERAVDTDPAIVEVEPVAKDDEDRVDWKEECMKESEIAPTFVIEATEVVPEERNDEPNSQSPSPKVLEASSEERGQTVYEEVMAPLKQEKEKSSLSNSLVQIQPENVNKPPSNAVFAASKPADFWSNLFGWNTAASEASSGGDGFCVCGSGYEPIDEGKRKGRIEKIGGSDVVVKEGEWSWYGSGPAAKAAEAPAGSMTTSDAPEENSGERKQVKHMSRQAPSLFGRDYHINILSTEPEPIIQPRAKESSAFIPGSTPVEKDGASISSYSFHYSSRPTPVGRGVKEAQTPPPPQQLALSMPSAAAVSPPVEPSLRAEEASLALPTVLLADQSLDQKEEKKKSAPPPEEKAVVSTLASFTQQFSFALNFNSADAERERKEKEKEERKRKEEEVRREEEAERRRAEKEEEEMLKTFSCDEKVRELLEKEEAKNNAEEQKVVALSSAESTGEKTREEVDAQVAALLNSPVRCQPPVPNSFGFGHEFDPHPFFHLLDFYKTDPQRQLGADVDKFISLLTHSDDMCCFIFHSQSGNVEKALGNKAMKRFKEMKSDMSWCGDLCYRYSCLLIIESILDEIHTLQTQQCSFEFEGVVSTRLVVLKAVIIEAIQKNMEWSLASLARLTAYIGRRELKEMSIVELGANETCCRFASCVSEMQLIWAIEGAFHYFLHGRDIFAVYLEPYIPKEDGEVFLYIYDILLCPLESIKLLRHGTGMSEETILASVRLFSVVFLDKVLTQMGLPHAAPFIYDNGPFRPGLPKKDRGNLTRQMFTKFALETMGYVLIGTLSYTVKAFTAKKLSSVIKANSPEAMLQRTLMLRKRIVDRLLKGETHEEIQEDHGKSVLYGFGEDYKRDSDDEEEEEEEEEKGSVVRRLEGEGENDEEEGEGEEGTEAPAKEKEKMKKHKSKVTFNQEEKGEGTRAEKTATAVNTTSDNSTDGSSVQKTGAKPVGTSNIWEIFPTLHQTFTSFVRDKVPQKANVSDTKQNIGAFALTETLITKKDLEAGVDPQNASKGFKLIQAPLEKIPNHWRFGEAPDESCLELFTVTLTQLQIKEDVDRLFYAIASTQADSCFQHIASCSSDPVMDEVSLNFIPAMQKQLYWVTDVRYEKPIDAILNKLMKCEDTTVCYHSGKCMTKKVFHGLVLEALKECAEECVFILADMFQNDSKCDRKMVPRLSEEGSTVQCNTDSHEAGMARAVEHLFSMFVLTPLTKDHWAQEDYVHSDQDKSFISLYKKMNDPEQSFELLTHFVPRSMLPQMEFIRYFITCVLEKILLRTMHAHAIPYFRPHTYERMITLSSTMHKWKKGRSSRVGGGKSSKSKKLTGKQMEEKKIADEKAAADALAAAEKKAAEALAVEEAAEAALRAKIKAEQKREIEEGSAGMFGAQSDADEEDPKALKRSGFRKSIMEATSEYIIGALSLIANEFERRKGFHI